MLVDEFDGVDKREKGGSDPLGVGEEERKLLNGNDPSSVLINWWSG